MLYHFDLIISSAMEQNSIAAPATHGIDLSEHQQMACQIIPQALSIALSIRELIRQGYLFGAKVLVRALVERAVILLYLYYNPDEIECWNRGWNHRDAPNLSKMMDSIIKKQRLNTSVKPYELTASMNSLVHAKPESSYLNLVTINEKMVGYSASKIINNPNLCDELCSEVIPWIAVVQSMMAAYFNHRA